MNNWTIRTMRRKNQGALRPWKKRLSDDRGIATVEMALALPLLAGLTFGMVDFGLALYNQASIANASREGARAGIVLTTPRPTENDIKGVVESYMTNAGLDSNAATITVTGEGGNFGDDLTVAVNYPHDFFVIGNLLPGIPQTLPLTSQTVMKLE